MQVHDLDPGRRLLNQEYADAANYDYEGTSDTGLAFYAALAHETGGPVLELGCGTGRAAVALARLGFEVTGVEVVRAMLEQARRKHAQPPVRWIEADARAFDLGQRFRLVFLTGNTFQAFLTNADQEAMLQCAHRHLASDGLLAFETRNPRWPSPDGERTSSPSVGEEPGVFALLEDRDAEEEGPGYVDAEGRALRVFRTQRYDHVSHVLTWFGRHVWSENGESREKHSRVSVRFTFPQELGALLHYTGFEITRRYGDWDLSPLSESSRSIIVVARKRL
jgi:SAM-dependent methyltransferase